MIPKFDGFVLWLPRWYAEYFRNRGPKLSVCKTAPFVCSSYVIGIELPNHMNYKAQMKREYVHEVDQMCSGGAMNRSAPA